MIWEGEREGGRKGRGEGEGERGRTRMEGRQGRRDKRWARNEKIGEARERGFEKHFSWSNKWFAFWENALEGCPKAF